MATQSVGKLGEPYTNLPPIYQTKSFDEAEHQKWSSSYSDYAAAIAAQSKVRMLAAKQRFDDAVKKFDAPGETVPEQKPSTAAKTAVASKPALIPRSEADWNRIASEATNGQLKTMADVEAWQRANGFSEDQIDGKFGHYSKS